MIADWEKAYKDMLAFEGGYANNPNDTGGETYKGIARNIWPKWSGWLILDYYKRRGYTKAHQINLVMEKDKRVEPLVMEFYKTNFWDKVHGDELPSHLARKVFDTAVNMGQRWGIRLLQRALNGVNIKTRLFKNLDDDGIYGKKTKDAINAVFSFYGETKGTQHILDWYSAYQEERYRAIVTRNPKQRIFLKGWLRRAAYRGD